MDNATLLLITTQALLAALETIRDKYSDDSVSEEPLLAAELLTPLIDHASEIVAAIVRADAQIAVIESQK